MKKLFVMDVQVGETECGMACGPCGGERVVEIKFRDENGAVMFFSFTEAGGIPCAFLTNKSTLEEQIEMDPEAQDFIAYLNDHATDIEDYEDIFSNDDDDLFEAYRYAIHLIECDDDEIEPFIKKTVGKWLHECDILVSDIEEMYIDEE